MSQRVTLLCGGLGGARLAPWLAERAELTVVVGVGDDLDLMGLRICPDIDAVSYALARLFDHDRGYAMLGETFAFRSLSSRLGLPAWFSVGDRDLQTHVARSALLASGLGLTAVTARLCDALGVAARVLPVTEDPVRTRILAAGGERSFQEFFVRDRAADPIEGVRWAGIETSRPAPGVLEAIASADVIVIGESSPVASVLPVISVPGVREALRSARAPRIALSPIVVSLPPREAVDVHHWRARRAFMAAQGLAHEPRAVCDAYADFVDVFVVDERDPLWPSERPRLRTADLLDRGPATRGRLVDLILSEASSSSTDTLRPVASSNT